MRSWRLLAVAPEGRKFTIGEVVGYGPSFDIPHSGVNARRVLPIGEGAGQRPCVSKLRVQRVADGPEMIRANATPHVAEVIQRQAATVATEEPHIGEAVGVPMPTRVHLTVPIFVGPLHPHPTARFPVRLDPFAEAGEGCLASLGAPTRESELFVGAAVPVGGGEAFASFGFALGLATKPRPVVGVATFLASAVLLATVFDARFRLGHRGSLLCPMFLDLASLQEPFEA